MERQCGLVTVNTLRLFLAIPRPKPPKNQVWTCWKWLCRKPKDSAPLTHPIADVNVVVPFRGCIPDRGGLLRGKISPLRRCECGQCPFVGDVGSALHNSSTFQNHYARSPVILQSVENGTERGHCSRFLHAFALCGPDADGTDPPVPRKHCYPRIDCTCLSDSAAYCCRGRKPVKT